MEWNDTSWTNARERWSYVVPPLVFMPLVRVQTLAKRLFFFLFLFLFLYFFSDEIFGLGTLVLCAYSILSPFFLSSFFFFDLLIYL